jgi:hypothetical protein
MRVNSATRIVLRVLLPAAALTAAMVVITAAQAGAELGPDKIRLATRPVVWSRTTATDDGTVTVTNTSNTPIAAPLGIRIQNISAAGVDVYNERPDDDAQPADANSAPLVHAYLPTGLLNPGETVAVPLKFSNPNRASFTYSIAAIGRAMDASNSAPLLVRVHKHSGDDANPMGAAAGPGFTIAINGVLRAQTDANGVATLRAFLDAVDVSAQRAPSQEGHAELHMSSGVENVIDITVEEDKEVYAGAYPQIDQVQRLLLPETFATLSIRFLRPDQTVVRLKEVYGIELWAAGNMLADVTRHFKLGKDGVLRCIELAAMKTLLAGKADRLAFEVRGDDGSEVGYAGDAPFFIARNRVRGALRAPASSTGLDFGTVRVVARMPDSGLVVATQPDSNGHFEFPYLPDGHVEVTSMVLQNGSYYSGRAALSLTGPTTVTIPMHASGKPSPAGAPQDE